MNRSGFVAVIGRPNVGKSTLVNRLVGVKVSIVSDKPQTTRTPIRGVLTRPDGQLIFVDTPGIHKPRTLLGGRLNDTAQRSTTGVDVVCVVIDGASGLGRGDERLLASAPRDAVVVVNKVDATGRAEVFEQLSRLAAHHAAAGGDAVGGDQREYFPVSARSGEGVEALADYFLSRLPEGPMLFPPDTVTDNPEEFWVAELVREQLLAHAQEELPHSIATRVTEWEGPRIRCEILVERDSQKGIVIGKGGLVLKAAGIAVRRQLPDGIFLELVVKVDKNWQRRAGALDRLGY